MKYIFLGYADEEFGYCLWDLVKHNIIRRKVVIFNELEMFKRSVGEVGVKEVIEKFEEQKENIPPMQEDGKKIQEEEGRQVESDEHQEEGTL